jgi:Kef-type K+ transport system membrane component KefB
MGGIGFFLFLLFFFSIAGYGANVSKYIQNPYLKAVCVMIVIAVINQLVTSFYDLQLTYYRNMIYLGSLLGLLPAIKDIQQKEKSQSNHDM